MLIETIIRRQAAMKKAKMKDHPEISIYIQTSKNLHSKILKIVFNNKIKRIKESNPV